DAPKRTDSKDRATVSLTVNGTGLMSIQPGNIQFQSNSDKLTIDSVKHNGPSPDTQLTIALSFAVPTAAVTPSPHPDRLTLLRSDGAMAGAVVPKIPDVPAAS